jgi:hypothetical protein
MALIDSLSDALELIEGWEEWKSGEEIEANGETAFAGHPWDELRTIKADMNILMMKRTHPEPMFDDADYEWLRAEALNRAAKRPPCDFNDVFSSCCKTLWEIRYPTREADIAHHRELKRSLAPLPQYEEV